MPSSYQPVRDLSIDLPFRRTPWDRSFEIVLPVLARMVRSLLPRRSLPESQLRALGIAVPPQLDTQLVTSALREIFRLLTGGWTRLDLASLEEENVSPWRSPGPILFLSMHHGQWEWLAAILTRLRPDALCVAKAPTHPAGRWLLQWVRSRLGLRMVHNLEAVRTVHRHLESSGLVAFLADQRPPGSARAGTWLGQPTVVSTLPDRWIQRTAPRLWTGVLIPSVDHYTLRLRAWDLVAANSWDGLLDQEFRDLVERSPWDHFGLWHHRLKPRKPPATPC